MSFRDAVIGFAIEPRVGEHGFDPSAAATPRVVEQAVEAGASEHMPMRPCAARITCERVSTPSESLGVRLALPLRPTFAEP